MNRRVWESLTLYNQDEPLKRVDSVWGCVGGVGRWMINNIVKGSVVALFAEKLLGEHCPQVF